MANKEKHFNVCEKNILISLILEPKQKHTKYHKLREWWIPKLIKSINSSVFSTQYKTYLPFTNVIFLKIWWIWAYQSIASKI